MKQTITTLLLTTALLAPAAAVRAQQSADKPEVIGLLFYSDTCASCKVLEPKLDTVKKGFADKPILFTRVDMTDNYTKAQSKLLAGALGLSDIYEENAPKTGFMLLVDAKDKKVLGKLDKTQSEAALKSNIAASLGSRPPAGSAPKPAEGSGYRPADGSSTR